MPLTTRAGGGVSTTEEESTGTLGTVGSGLGNAVNPPGSGTASATGFGSSFTSGSTNLPVGAGYQSGIGSLGSLLGSVGGLESGSGSVTGSSGSISPTRRSTTSSTPGDVEGGVSQLSDEAASAVGGTTSTSNPIPGDVTGAISTLDGEVASAPEDSGASAANAVNSLRLRAVTDSASGSGQLVGGLGEVAGAAAGQASGAGNGAKGTRGCWSCRFPR